MRWRTTLVCGGWLLLATSAAAAGVHITHEYANIDA